MAELGWFVGSMAGTAADPFTWVAILICAGLAYRSFAPWWVLLVAAAYAAFAGVLVASNARMIGRQYDAGQLFLKQMVLVAIWCGLAYLVVYLLRRRSAR